MSYIKCKISGVRPAFTLPELLIVISIFVLVSIIAVASFRGFDTRSKLGGARDLIINDFLDTQSNSVGGKLVKLCVDESNNDTPTDKGFCSADADCGGYGTTPRCKWGTPRGGYGIAFAMNQNGSYAKDTYVLFADFDNNRRYTSNSELSELLINPSGEKTLPNKITFGGRPSYISVNNATLYNYFPIQVLFQPNGAIIISDSNGESSNIKIQKIPLTGLMNNMTIYINKYSGLIYGDIDSIEPTPSPS